MHKISPNIFIVLLNEFTVIYESVIIVSVSLCRRICEPL